MDVTRIASSRLIDAAGALDPADRALLNLWVHRDFDDGKLAAFTGMTVERIAARREALVAGLSAELGLPPDDVLSALRGLEASGNSNGSAPPDAAVADAERVAAREPADARKPVAPAEPAAATGSRRRRRNIAAAGAAVALIAVGLIVVLAGGGTSSHRAQPRAAATARPPTPPAAPAAAAPATSTAPAALQPLAGGPSGLGGSVTVVGPPAAQRLVVRLHGLPPLPSGHYELWLYNSIIDSLPLASVAARSGAQTVILPRDHRRFRWLDISRQPAGAVRHSGISVLRVPAPG